MTNHPTLLELVNLISEKPVSGLTDDTAFEPLLALLFSDALASDREIDADYRVSIARHLLSSGTPAITLLVDYIKHEQEKTYGSVGVDVQSQEYRDNSCAKIAELIGELGDDVSLSALLEILHNSKGISIPLSVIRAIIKLDTTASINQLTELLLNHESSLWRAIIAEELSNSSHPQVTSALLLALKDVSARVAISAARSLGKIKSPHALPFLIEATTDFRSRSKDDSSFPDTMALASIGAIHSYQTEETKKIVFEWCVDNLKNHTVEIRFIAIHKFKMLGNKDAIPYLAKALDDQSYWKTLHQTVSDVAQDALQVIGTPEALAALEAWKQNHP